MSDTKRMHETRILRVRQRRRRSKPSEDEHEAQTHHRTTTAVVRLRFVSSRRPRQHSRVSSLRKSNKTNIKRFLPRSTRAASSPPAGNEGRRRCVFSLTFAYRTQIDFFFFFFFSFFSSCSCNTLFQQLRGVVSEVKAQRVTHLLITRRGNSSTNLVFLGFFVFFIVAATSKQTRREARGTVCVCDSRCFSCTCGLSGGRRQKQLNRF